MVFVRDAVAADCGQLSVASQLHAHAGLRLDEAGQQVAKTMTSYSMSIVNGNQEEESNA